MVTKEVLIPVKRLYQFSTTNCGPCNMMKSYITKQFKEKGIHYQYVNLEAEGVRQSDIKMAVDILKVSSVPRFAIVEDGEVIEDFGDPKSISFSKLRKKVEQFFNNV